jgi:peptidyl-prolyl cis-trans isomerase C
MAAQDRAPRPDSQEFLEMRMSKRSRLVMLLVAGSFPLTGARAQAPKAAAAPPAARSGAAVPAPTGLDQVVATINGDRITRGDLLNFLSRYPIPPLTHEQIYHDGVETLINTRLIGQFLSRQNVAAPPGKVEEAIAQLQRDLKADGRELQAALVESRVTMDDLRREYVDRIRWVEFVHRRATDAELKKFAATHNDLISGTQIKASHIYIMVPDNASAADKEKTRRKLLAIKQDILDKKITFADAANKFSEDPANAKGEGGDIGYFGLSTGVVDEFATAAFALKPGEISDPVETVHGLHLIEVTDRREGSPVDFEQQRPYILQLYAADLQKEILTAERDSAEQKHAIDIKPMPPDLFPPSPPADAAPAAAPVGAPPGAGSTKPR